MRTRIISWLTVLVLVVSLAAATAIVPVQASAQKVPVSGTWTVSDVSGSGTYSNGVITGGSFWCTLTYSGDISGTSGLFELKFNPVTDNFEGWTTWTSAATITVQGITYSARYFAFGTAAGVSIGPITGPPYQATFSFTPVGEGIGATKASEADDWLAIGESTGGSGSGVIHFDASNWWVNVGDVQVLDCTWSGYAYHLAGPATIDEVPAGSNLSSYLSLGGWQVALAQHPNAPTTGAIVVAQYAENPGNSMPVVDLGTYVEFHTNIPTSFWSDPVEIRIYYTDQQVADAGTDEHTLKMYRYDGSQWVQYPDSEVNMELNYVWAVTNQFGAFGVGGDPAAGFGGRVTLQTISVTVSEGYPTLVDYGPMGLGAEATPVAYLPSGPRYLQVQNDGSIVEDFFIRGTDATCGAGTWTLASEPGTNQYSHLFGTGQTPETYWPLSSTLLSSLATEVGTEATVDFNLKIRTPTTSDVWGQYSTTVSVIAIAS